MAKKFPTKEEISFQIAEQYGFYPESVKVFAVDSPEETDSGYTEIHCQVSDGDIYVLAMDDEGNLWGIG